MKIINFRFVCISLFLMVSLVMAQHPYESIWSGLVDEYTHVKKSKGVAYVYVDYASLVKTQNFRLLGRILPKIDPDTLTKDAYLSYLINYYNIKVVESVYLKDSVDMAFFADIKTLLTDLDVRSLFCLSADDIYFPNLIAYSSIDLSDQLDKQVNVTLAKLFRYDKGVGIIYVHDWFDQQPFTAEFKQSLILQGFPKYHTKKLTIHSSHFGSVSNAIEK